ncbi:SCO-spondin [Biomphalaria glabrata]|nr:SCO-spondin [Biomphalaria glabrata]
MTPQPVDSKFNPVTTNLPSSEDIPQIGVIDNSRGNLQNIDLSNGGQVLVPVDERTFNPVEESKPIYFTYPKDSSNDVPEDIKNIPGLSTVYIVSPPGAPDEFLVLVVIKPSESFTVPEKGTPYIPLNDTSSTLPKLNEEKTVFVVIPKYTTVTYEVCEEQPPGSESTSVSQSTPAQPTETETTSPTVTLPVGSSTSSAPTVSVTETVSETTVPSTSGTTTSGRTGATTTGATTLVTTGGTTSGTTGATTSGTTGPTTSGSTLTTAGPCGVSMTPQPVDSKFNPVTTNLPSSEDIPQIGVIDNSRGNLQNIDLSNGGQVLVPVDERTFNPVEESKPIYFTYPKDSSNDVPEDIKNIPGLSTVYIVSPPGAPDEFLVLVVIKPSESFTVPEKGTPYIPLNDTSSTLPKLNEEKTVFVVIPKYTTVTYEVCEGGTTSGTTGATTSGTTGPTTSGSTLTTAGPCGVSMTPQPVDSKFNPVTTNLPSSEDIPQIGVIDNSRGNLQNIDLSNGGQVLVPVDERTFNPVEESKPIYFTYPKDSSNDVPEDIKNIPGLSTVYIVSPPGAPDEFLVLVVIKPTESFTVPEKGTAYIPLNDTSSTLPKLNEEKTVFVVIPKYTTVTYEVCEGGTTSGTTGATTSGTTGPTTSGSTLTTAGPCGVSMTPQPVDSKFNPVTTNLPSSEDIPQIGVIDNSRGNLQNIDLSNGGQVLVPVDERTFNPVEESKPIYFTYPKDSSNDVPEDIKNIPGLSTVYIVSPPGAPDEFLVLVVIKPTESFTVPEKGTPYIPLVRICLVIGY